MNKIEQLTQKLKEQRAEADKAHQEYKNKESDFFVTQNLLIKEIEQERVNGNIQST